MFKRFQYFPQRDAMDCGPACLMMVAAAHGRTYSLPYLRERSYLSRDGVSALGIMEAAESIGFRTMTISIPFDSGKDTACLLSAPLPCIAHWNQNHFVVVYEVTPKYVRVADPGAGKFKVPRKEFERAWSSNEGRGIVVLLEPTPVFYENKAGKPVDNARLSYLFGYIKPHARLVWQVLIGMLIASTFQLIFPFLTQSIVDFGIQNGNLDFIYIILAAQLMLFFSQTTVQFVQNRIQLFIGTRVNLAMVSDFLAKLTRLSIGFFDTKITGDLLQRIQDQTRVETFLTQSALPVLFSLVNFLVFGIILLQYSPAIFGIFAVSALLYVSWVAFFLRRRKEIDYLHFQQASETNNNLIEMIQGMQEIKLQGSERKRRWIWASTQAKLFRTNFQALSLSQWQDAGAAFINQGKSILIISIAAKAVISGQMTLGMMLATQYMVGQLEGPLQQFIGFIRSAQDAKISLERMGEVRDQPDEDTADGLEKTGEVPTASDIHLESLCFRYSPIGDNILKNINLRIPHGKVTALVGTSGSGKTTLVKLLLGFYKPTSGQIRIGSTPLQYISSAVWRKHCGAVMQDGFIFSDTIANNISESEERLDREKLHRAIAVANMQDFVEGLPLGYNTMVGAKGNGISQGQRQRLLIARAAYRNPDFLFFDEATNALDANNERVISENLQGFYHNKTVVIVAHRLSTVRHADQIAVLERGEIVEQGTHEELVQHRGAYYELVRNQLELGS